MGPASPEDYTKLRLHLVGNRRLALSSFVKVGARCESDALVGGNGYQLSCLPTSNGLDLPSLDFSDGVRPEAGENHLVAIGQRFVNGAPGPRSMRVRPLLSIPPACLQLVRQYRSYEGLPLRAVLLPSSLQDSPTGKAPSSTSRSTGYYWDSYTLSTPRIDTSNGSRTGRGLTLNPSTSSGEPGSGRTYLPVFFPLQNQSKRLFSLLLTT